MKHCQFTRLCASWAFLWALCLPGYLSAQCECVSPDPTDPQNLYVEFDCMKLIDHAVLDDLLPPNCSGPYTFYVLEIDDDTIGFGSPDVMVDLSGYIGLPIKVQAVDNNSAMMCTNYFIVMDTIGPMMDCPSDTILCHEYPDQVKDVTAVDLCSNVTFIDTVEMFDGFMTPCLQGDFYGKITRIIRTQDDGGNMSSCSQEIFVEKSDTADVLFPIDTLLDCTESPDPSVAGLPSLNGVPFENSLLCNLELGVADTVIMDSCGDRTILRYWNLLNTCNSDLRRDTQIILLQDTIPTTVNCQSMIVFPTDTTECVADITLPTPIVTDNCSGFTISANIPGFTGTGLSFTDIPKGEYNIEYVVTDSCGNMATCDATLIIEDNETPSAVCDGVKVVTLNSNGEAILEAEAFDDGSNDNCVPFPLLDF